jgi:hypothetical protein
MRSCLRLVLPLVFSIILGSLLFATYQVRTEKRDLRNDLQRHAALLAETLRETIEPVLETDKADGIGRIVEKLGHGEHLNGVAVYDENGNPLVLTRGLKHDFLSRSQAAIQASASDQSYQQFLTIGDTPLHIFSLPLHRSQDVVGALVLYHNTSYIESQIARMWRDALVNATMQTILISTLALLLIRQTFIGPLVKTARWMRSLRSGGGFDSAGASERQHVRTAYKRGYALGSQPGCCPRIGGGGSTTARNGKCALDAGKAAHQYSRKIAR